MLCCRKLNQLFTEIYFRYYLVLLLFTTLCRVDFIQKLLSEIRYTTTVLLILISIFSFCTGRYIYAYRVIHPKNYILLFYPYYHRQLTKLHI